MFKHTGDSATTTILPGQSVVPTVSDFTTAFLVNYSNPFPPGDTPKPFTPGMTTREKIEQVSREDPIYGSIVKSIESGSAHKSLITSKADPYTGYAAAHLAKEAKHAPSALTRFWYWLTDRSGSRDMPGYHDYKHYSSGTSIF